VNAELPAETENPFVTRRVRPGAFPFFFPPQLDAAALLARWQAAGRRGALVGPHGSGKSTLLATLRAELTRRGQTTVLVELHDGQRRLPVEQLAAVAPGDVVLLDGYEQLGLLGRWRLTRLCRRHKLGLLITMHRPARLPTLYHTAIDLLTARRVVDHLLGDQHTLVTDAQLRAALARHHDDLREVLFELYDLYAQHTAER
jgi:hypothetical protein